MNNFHTLPNDSKRIIIEQTALKQGLSKQIVEKDLWVSTLLEIVFTIPFANKLSDRIVNSLDNAGKHCLSSV